MTNLHVSNDRIVEFLLGKLGGDVLTEVEGHLSECQECETRAAQLTATDGLTRLLSVCATIELSGADTPSPTELTTPPVAGTVGWGDQEPVRSLTGESDVASILVDHPRYRPVRLLGTGGMGSVWLAEHVVMRRQVAVKIMRPELLVRPGAAERFIREVRAAAQLQHPNIVSAYDAEEVDGLCFLIMEYVPGETLASIVKAGPMPLVDACRAIRDAAVGLSHAHRAGLTHRDVKPGNLIRTPDGITKVLDFGLVANEPERESGLTAENMVLGTPDYIAPEQAEDPRATDHRADIYALGCTLFHLLSGRVPFPAASTVKKIDAHRAAPLPDLPGTPSELVNIVRRMTAKDPNRRFQSAEDVAVALKPFCDPERRFPSRQREKLTLWLAVGMAAAIVVAIAGIAVIWIQRGNEVIAIETDDPDIEVAMRRNGELVRVVDVKRNQTLDLDTKKMRLAADGGELTIDLPDQDKLTIRRNGDVAVTIRRHPAAGKSSPPAMNNSKEERNVGDVRVLRSPQGLASNLVVSADGRYAFAGGGYPERGFSQVLMWDLRRGALVGQFPPHSDSILQVQLSKDESRILSASFDGTIQVYDTASRKLLKRIVVDKSHWVFQALFVPGGREAVSSTTMIQFWDIQSGKETSRLGDPALAESQIRAMALSPDEKKLASAGTRGHVRLWDLESGKLLKDVGGDQPNALLYCVPFSPDGSVLLSAGSDSIVRFWDVASGKLLRSIEHGTPIYASAFSPGGRIVATGGQDAAAHLWDAASGKVLATFPGHRDAIFGIAFTPDGKHLLTSSIDRTVRVTRLPETLVDQKRR